MSSSTLSQFADADDYEEHVANFVRNDVTPSPPMTKAEALVIWDEYPKLLAEYLPLILADTPCRRAFLELMAEIQDQ